MPHLMQKMGDALKLNINWRSSSDEEAAGDRLKVHEGLVMVNRA